MKIFYIILIALLAGCSNQNGTDNKQNSQSQSRSQKQQASKQEPVYVLGTARRVYDGDSFVFVSDDKQSYEVRMLEIDAPERYQVYADESRAALEKLLMGREIALSIEDTDRYKRSLSYVFDGETGENLNHAMILEGHAWVYKKYRDDKKLMKLENYARSEGLGLWGARFAKEPVPPWVYRQNLKNN